MIVSAIGLPCARGAARALSGVVSQPTVAPPVMA